MDPYIPVLILPRHVCQQKDANLFAITGSAHDICLDAMVDVDGQVIYSTEHVLNLVHPAQYKDGGMNENLGDAYHIGNVSNDGKTLEIQGHNFFPNDTIQITSTDSTHMGTTHTIESTTIDEITLTSAATFDSGVQYEARLVFGVVNETVDECEAEPIALKLIGISGYAQPEQAIFNLGLISIATIVRGPTPVQMTEEECESFAPGDTVYINFHIDQDSKSISLTFTTSHLHFDTPTQSFLLGTFVSHMAHSVGALGLVCLACQKPQRILLD